MPDDLKKDGQVGDKIKVDDKEYSVDDVKNLLTGAAAATQQSQQAKKFIDAAKAYGVEPDELLEQSMGAFRVVGTLIENKVIDQEGNLIMKKDEHVDDPDDLAKLLNLKKKGGEKLELDGATKAILEGLNAMREELKTYKGEISDLRSVQTGIVRKDYEREIKTVYPNLTSRDISEVFGTAIELRKQGKKVDLLEVAKVVSEARGGEAVNVTKEWCKTHGLDYDKITAGTDENSLREQIAKGGAGVVLGGKKVSLFGGKDGEVSVADAANAFLKAQQEK